MFPLLNGFLTENEISAEAIASTVSNHFQQLSHYFHEYFGDDDVSMFDWIRNQFQCLLTDLTGREQEELAELSSDRSLQLQFTRTPLFSFWLSCHQLNIRYCQRKPLMFCCHFLRHICANKHFLLSLRWKQSTEQD